MARLLNNPLGPITGKAGALVFKRSKYGNYISSLPSPSHKKRTKPQQLQQDKMKAVMEFLTPLRVILEKTYFPSLQHTPRLNVIKSYYLRHALQTNEGNYKINYAQCLLSYGELRIPEKIHVQGEGLQEVFLTWEPNENQALANKNDQLFAVVYHPPSHQFYFAPQIGFRETGNGSFFLPQVWSSFTNYHLWMGYLQPKNQQASVSVYIGSLP